VNKNIQKFPSGERRVFTCPEIIFAADGVTVADNSPAQVWVLAEYAPAPGDTRAAPAIGTAMDAMPAPYVAPVEGGA